MSESDALHTRSSSGRAQGNKDFAVEYTKQTLDDMLLAWTDDGGCIKHEHYTKVHRLFDQHDAWKLGTPFRRAWTALPAKQEEILMQEGWTREQIEEFYNDPGPPGIDPLSMVFQVGFVLYVLYCFSFLDVIYVFLLHADYSDCLSLEICGVADCKLSQCLAGST